MGGKAEVDGFHGGEDREREKKRGERRMPPMQSSVREHLPGATLSSAADKPSIVALEREKKNAQQRNSRSRSASERVSGPFMLPQADRQKVLLLFSRQTVCFLF